MYSWGWGIHGQLGHGDVEEKLVPQHVKALANKNVVRVSGGYNHSIVLTSQVHVLSCQLRVTVTSCFVYKVNRGLESIDHLRINTQVIYQFTLAQVSVQVNVLLNNCKQNKMSLSLLAGRTVVSYFFFITFILDTHKWILWQTS